MASKPKACRPARVFLGHGGCDCMACAERQQLTWAAAFDPKLEVRTAAQIFLGALDDVQHGRSGAIGIANLFD